MRILCIIMRKTGEIAKLSFQNDRGGFSSNQKR